MNNLSDNPHAELAETDIEYPGDWNELEAVTALLQTSARATLALAYEQRTANLIAVATAVSENGVYQLDPALIGAAQEELATRLGLGDTK